MRTRANLLANVGIDGTHLPRFKDEEMQIDGAIVKEQGVTFSIVIVKPNVIQSRHSADRARRNFSTIADFSGIPMVLAAQDVRGRFTYQGRNDIVDFLANIDSSRIPWSRYTVA